MHLRRRADESSPATLGRFIDERASDFDASADPTGRSSSFQVLDALSAGDEHIAISLSLITTRSLD